MELQLQARSSFQAVDYTDIYSQVKSARVRWKVNETNKHVVEIPTLDKFSLRPKTYANFFKLRSTPQLKALDKLFQHAATKFRRP